MISTKAPSQDELRAAEFMAEQELASMIRQIVDESGVDRQEVARRLGVHKSNVSKILNSPRNMTVRMAARLLRAVGQRLCVSAFPVPEQGQSHADGLRAHGANIEMLFGRALTTGTATANPSDRPKTDAARAVAQPISLVI